MKHSPHLIRTTLTAAALSVCLMVSAAALPYGVGTTTGNLRLRQSASTSGSILATVPEGTEVSVLEAAQNGWYKVEWNGQQGYMSADYLTVRVNPTELGTGTPNTGSDYLNMRSGPGTGYSKVGSIPPTATLTITAEENGWYKTSYNGVTGYVSSAFVTLTPAASTPSTPATPTSPTAPTAPTAPSTPTVSTVKTGKLNTGGSSLNMRSGPGTGYSKVGSIPANATLAITAEENGWYKTSYNGVTGYVSSAYVIVTETPVSTGGTAPPTIPSTAPTSQKGDEIVAYAKEFLGVPYRYGANGPSSYDCSAFTYTVYKHFGRNLNRSAAGQYNNGTVVDQSQMQPGDLLLWRAYGSSSIASHVGIYIGNNQYIHASSSAGCVTINDLSYGSSTRYLVGVRRIVS